MKSLIDLASESKSIVDRLIANGGELDEDLERELEVSSRELSEKIDSYKFVLEELKLREAFWRQIKDEASAAQRSVKNGSENLKSRIRYAMKHLEVDELSGSKYRAKLSAAKSKILISDESLIPSEYLRERVVREPDKEKILQELLKGNKIDGCVLEDSKSLRFYTSKG